MRAFVTILLVALAGAPLSAQVSLVAHYRMDETSGSTLVDAGPNGLSGIYVSGYTLGQPGAASGTGTSVSFSEVAFGHAEIPQNAPLAAITADTAYAAWFTTTSTQGYRRVFASEVGGIGVGIFYNNLLFTTRGVQDYVQPANLQVNTWYHAAWVFDANYSCSFYLNGQFLGSVQGNAAAFIPGTVFHVGSRAPNTELWDGSIDDIQIYQGTLSATEVAFLFGNPGVALGAPPAAYCTGGTSANGCVASISGNAQPSVSLANPCTILVSSLEGQKSGILFYGLGQTALPWASGSSSFLCVKPPTQRTLTQSSGGTAGACDGTLMLDWNAYQQANPGSLGNPWTVGSGVYCQGWYRDPPAPKTTSLSNALWLIYQP